MTEVETGETSLTIRRTFDAPRERVFQTFVDADDLEAWQSVGEIGVEVHTLEPEPGGSLSTSHLVGGDRHDFEGEYLEVVEHERLVYTMRAVGGPHDGVESRFIVEFRDVDGETQVTFTQEQVEPEMLEGTVETWDEMLGNLEDVLAEA